MIDLRAIAAELSRRGYLRDKETDKKILFLSPKDRPPLYLNKTAGSSPSSVIVHPQYLSIRDKLLELKGVKSKDVRYHSSNMRDFPQRVNRGKTPTPYGVPFGFESEGSLRSFLDYLAGKVDAVPDLLDDLAAESQSLSGLAETEREALTKSRIGQGLFRQKLIKYWGRCAVTGCDALSLLRASHIKPWRDASNSERLDHFNGLLLNPNMDAAFDQGMVSFTDSGKIMISPALSDAHAKALGILATMQLSNVDAEHLPFLRHHRNNVFIKS